MTYQNLRISIVFFHWFESYSVAEIHYFKIEEIIRPLKLSFNDLFLKH